LLKTRVFIKRSLRVSVNLLKPEDRPFAVIFKIFDEKKKKRQQHKTDEIKNGLSRALSGEDSITLTSLVFLI